MEHPGKRAPTVQICNSDKEYQPLAMRQHATGPYPFDPNLIAQGIPLDNRVDEGERLYAPIEGTPPPNTVPSPPDPEAALPRDAGTPPAAPAAFQAPAATPGPSVAVAPYNVVTGQYTSPDGAIGSQTDLVSPAETWQELMPR